MLQPSGGAPASPGLREAVAFGEEQTVHGPEFQKMVQDAADNTPTLQMPQPQGNNCHSCNRDNVQVRCLRCMLGSSASVRISIGLKTGKEWQASEKKSFSCGVAELLANSCSSSHISSTLCVLAARVIRTGKWIGTQLVLPLSHG